MEIFRALGCADEASCRALTRSHDQGRGEEPPHLILLVRGKRGGDMDGPIDSFIIT